MRRREEGASAVEFAIIAPLLFMLLFGIIGFGLAFLQVQSIRTAVREGGRYAATGAPVDNVLNSDGSIRIEGIRHRVQATSSGYIPSNLTSSIVVVPSSAQGAPCTSSTIGQNVDVRFDTSLLPGGGVIVHIPLLPVIKMTPLITASFRCEV